MSKTTIKFSPEVSERAMISFIDENRGVFGVERSAGCCQFAPSTYCENVAKRLDVHRLSIRARSDICPKIEISGKPTVMAALRG